MREHQRGSEFFWHEGAHHADGWWAGPVHFVALLLLVALVVVGVVWLVRRFVPSAAVQTVVPAAVPAAAIAADPAVDLLRMRYARGEVSHEDFRRTMEDLTGAAAETATWPGRTPDGESTPTA